MPRSASFLALVLGVASLAGCNTEALAPCVHPPPVFGDGGGQDMAMLQSPVCRHIYVVDEARGFAAFDPVTYKFQTLGRLACRASSPMDTPFSMSVARDGIAWVLYNQGELFRVDINNPASCAATSFKAGQFNGFIRFGMGFSSDAPGGSAETLFLADTLGGLGSLDLRTLLVKQIGALTGSPELTGTGQAELWGWFPQLMDTDPPPFVAQIDKTTAATSNTFVLPTLAGSPLAWAFAFWGGDFFIFLRRTNDVSTVVWKLNRATGQLDMAVPNAGRSIVGAGVSSCAPVAM